MEYRAAVITMSDKGSQGLRKDTAGDAVVEILEKNGWTVAYRTLIPDDMERIKEELIKCADELKVTLTVPEGCDAGGDTGSCRQRSEGDT